MNLQLEWSLIQSEEELRSALDETRRHNLIAVDTETTKEERYGSQVLIGISWGFPVGTSFRAYYAPFRHGDFSGLSKNLDPSLLYLFNELKEKDQIYHNALFDLTVLLKEGISFEDCMIWDTMIMSHLVNEAEFSYGLDDLSNKYYKDRKKNLSTVEKEIGWDKIPAFLMGEYACTDVFLTFKHYLRTLPTLEHEDLISVYTDSQRYLKVLRRIVDRGLYVDPTLAQGLQEAAQGRCTALRDGLGLDPAKAGQVRTRLHSGGSEGLGLPVLYRTKGKQPAVDSTSLIRYANQFEEARELAEKITEYRQLSKAISTWYQGFFTKTDVQGRLHPGLNQTGTRTGRLSCREPNLQQIPRSGQTRSLFVDTEDSILVEFDFSQIELRLGSWYLMKRGDTTLYNAYKEGTDVHITTAERMGLIRTLGKKEGRQLGKTINFLLLYGGGSTRLKETLYKDSKGQNDYSLAQTTEWVNSYRKAYPGVPILNDECSNKWVERSYLRMWNGRRRHYNKFRDNHRAAFNSLIQGGCGQILMYALINLDQEMPNLRIVNTVHDSVWIYFKNEEEVQEQTSKIISIMKRVPEDQFDMPFEIEWKYWRDTL